MAGFDLAYILGGGEVNIQEFVVKASEVLTQGEMCSLDTGEIDAAATNDAAFVGVALESVDNTVDGHTIRVIINPDAVYSVVDANARLAGVNLDIATGGLGVTTDSNHDFIVVAPSSATERTLVMFAPGEHYLR
jgi:hypothetical protein